MAKDQQNSSGGPAAHAGTNYQNRVAAWSAVYILAEQDAVPPWDLAASVTLEALQAEARSAVDDLAVYTSSGGVVRSQIKHALSLETSAGSEFGAAVSQLVKECRAATPPQDPTKDRLVIATTSLSSAPVKTHIPRFLTRVRSSSAPDQEWTGGNSQENAAAATLKQHVTGAWRKETGADPSLDEIHAILRLIRIQILDVDEGAQSEREAKQMLRSSILVDPTQADTAWSTLITATASYATKRQRADRNALQRVLTDAGIPINASHSYRADIQCLKDQTAATLRGLIDFSRIHVGGQDVIIQRAVAPILQAAASDGHLLVLGLPGAGKSAAMHNLAHDIDAIGADVVLLAVDQIEAASSGALRGELNLTHELLAVLSNWPGTTPSYLIIDSLDAARSESAVKTLQTLIRNVSSTPGRWHVVASVRKFDLRYDRDLQRLFRGTPVSRQFTDGEFGSVRHVNVPVLSDEELDQLKTRCPTLSTLVSDASAPFRGLLHLPFNLRLLADLLDAGITEEELRPVQTQVELLQRYWHKRVVRHDREGDARELVLRRVVSEMVKARSLRVARSVAIANEAASSVHLDDLLSTHVLAEWTPQTGTALRDFLTFSHHLLFDYAVARLYLPPEPVPLIALLGQQADLLITIRPSIELHFQRLWHEDQATFWDLTFCILESPLSEIGKLLGPSVAALFATTSEEIQPLIDCLVDPMRGDTGLAALRHILATRLTHGLVAGLVKPGPWAEFLDTVAATPTPTLANAIRPYVNFLSENFAALDEHDRLHVGGLVRRVLVFCLTTEPFNIPLANNMILAVARSVASDPSACITILRQCITEEHLANHGFRTFPTLARQATFLLPFDAEFVRDVYAAGFSHKETSDQKTTMGDSQILPMSSNRRQDYDTGLWSLAEQFPKFLEKAPRQALDALLKTVDPYVTNRRKVTSDIVPVTLNGIESALRRDNSFIWDGGASQIENVPRMIQAFHAFLEGLTDSVLIGQLVNDIAVRRPPGTIWRLLLEAGTAQPSTIGKAVRSLAWDHFILTERDTGSLAGFFLQAIFPLLCENERARVEETILNIPVSAPEDPNAASRACDRLLGCLDRTLLVTRAAISRRNELDTAGGQPQNHPDPKIEFSSILSDQDDYLRQRNVPVDDPENQRLLALGRPLGAFGNKFLNNTPPEDRIRDILPYIGALDAELSTAQTLHPDIRSRILCELVNACKAILRKDAFPLDADTLALMQTIILKAAVDPDPAPNPKRDEGFQESPGWGSTTRVEAAQAAMLLAHRSTSMAAAMESTIVALADDSVAVVRFQIARAASYLLKTTSDLMLRLLEQFATAEGNRGVLQGTLDVLQWYASADPPRVARMTLAIFDRLPAEGPGVRDVQDQCCNVFSGLAIWREDPTCLGIIEKMTSSPAQYRLELGHIIFDLSAWLQEKKQDVRKRTFDLLERILDVNLEAARVMDPELDGRTYDALTKTDQDLYGAFLKNIDEVALRLYLISGALSDRQFEPLPSDPNFYELAKPLLVKLASIGHPYTAHHVIETLIYFTSVDPPGVLLLVSDVVRAGSAQGYHYEQLGEEAVVRMVKRYLSEYRTMLREHRECHAALMQILDVFVRVGWPQAHQLTYRLGEIYR